jgi:hypothetical protein
MNSAATTRTVEGQQVIVGGVTVTVELNEGELDIRVSACDDSEGEGEGEGDRIDLHPMAGIGHGNIYVTGSGLGVTSHERFTIHRKTVSN